MAGKPVVIQLLASQDAKETQSVAEAVVNQWGAVGLTVNMKILDSQTHTDVDAAGTWDMSVTRGGQAFALPFVNVTALAPNTAKGLVWHLEGDQPRQMLDFEPQLVDTAKYAKPGGGYHLCFSNASVDNPWRQVGIKNMQAEVKLHPEIKTFTVADAQDLSGTLGTALAAVALLGAILIASLLTLSSVAKRTFCVPRSRASGSSIPRFASTFAPRPMRRISVASCTCSGSTRAPATPCRHFNVARERARAGSSAPGR